MMTSTFNWAEMPQVFEAIESDNCQMMKEFLDDHGTETKRSIVNKCLVLSLQNNSLSCVFCLLWDDVLASGVDPNCTDELGRTVLMLAVLADQSDVIKRLLELGGDISRRDTDHYSAIDLACKRNNVACVQALLSKTCRDDRGVSRLPKELAYHALISAARSGHHETLETLIESGIGVDLNLDPDIGPALHAAIESDSVPSVLALLSAHADVENLRLCTLQSPLVCAAQLGNAEIVQALLQAGCDVNRETDNCSTALTVACHYGQTRAFQLLLDYGADPHRKNRWGFTPLYLGTDSLLITEILLKRGVSVNEPCGDRAEAPIHLASVIGCPQVSQLLIDAGANINIKTVYNETPLWLAAWKGNDQVARQLIQLNCEINVASNGYQVYVWEYLPLEVALGSGNYAITQMLLQAGCSLTNRRYFCGTEEGPITALPGLRLRKEVFDLIQLDRSALSWLISICQNPRSLRNQCRIAIRQKLGKDLQFLVDKLPLPPMLKSFLMMPHV